MIFWKFAKSDFRKIDEVGRDACVSFLESISMRRTARGSAARLSRCRRFPAMLSAFVQCAVAIVTLAVATSVAAAQQPFVTIEGDTKGVAWWVLADFHPFTTDIRGLPVGQIRKNWCKASEFRKDLIPKELLLEGNVDVMESYNVSFSLEGSFDGSTAKQIALVGVYEECTGKKGRFFLILDQLAAGPPKLRFASAVQTNRQFAALSRGANNTLSVWTCMGCDALSILKWDRRKRKFVWLPEPNVD